ncbi:MAG: D-amino acid aminotransferase [Gammaproteobacteria bacterium]
MSTVYLNGQFMPIEDAKVSVLDRGFLFGDGVYEVVPVFKGKTFRLTEHLYRLDNSLQAIRVANPLSNDQWRSLVVTLIERNGGGDQIVYIQITRGVAPKRDHVPTQPLTPTVFAMSNPVVRDNYKSIAVVTVDDIRWQWCNVKAIALLANVMMRMNAADQGAYEALLVRDGLVTEGAASNVLIVRDGRVITPPHSNRLLPGVTRDLLVQILPKHGIECIERMIEVSELETADEIWVTGSSREIAPVTTLNHRPVGDGVPGPVWKRAVAIYEAFRDAAIASGQ